MKKDQYKAVIAGFAHVHINGVAAHFAGHPRINLCACADLQPLVPELKVGPYTREWNIDFCSKKFNLKVYADWIEMLDADKPALCVVNSEKAITLITEDAPNAASRVHRSDGHQPERGEMYSSPALTARC
jgi:hypothetical protein